MKNLFWIILFFFSGVIVLTSCKRFVDIDPPVEQVDKTTIYKSDASAAAVLTGIYENLDVGTLATGTTSLSVSLGLSSDELFLAYSGIRDQQQLYANALLPDNGTNSMIWKFIYGQIYSCNSALEGLQASASISNKVKTQLEGEAYFCRAFLYFYLVNLYGDVPLIKSTDYRVNMTAPRSGSTVVYMQIKNDLLKAQQLLTDNYLTPLGGTTAERVRPNKGAVTALLARVYLYQKEYQNAEIEAGKLIANKAVYDTVPLNEVFRMNSKEAIWQLQSVYPSINVYDAFTFVLTTNFDPIHPVSLSDQLMGAFLPGDQRRTNWIGKYNQYYFPYKYKVFQNNQAISEYCMVFRLAEQYLIRAEARIQLNNLPGACEDLNIIRTRAGLSAINLNDKKQLLQEIIYERQAELFTEWGHRWLDLKRMAGINNPSISLADEVMPSVCIAKGGHWNTNWQLFPVPQTEISKDHNLHQNPGYPQ